MSRACEVCDSLSFVPLFKKDGYPYEKCVACGLIRLNPQPSDEALEAIYQSDYFGGWGGSEDVFRDLKRRTFPSLLGMLPKEARGGKLLDVGAATGVLMELAQEWGYEPYGVEAAKDGASAIERKFGRDHVFSEYFDRVDFQAAGLMGAFEVVTMADLFEHVRDPNETLRQVSSLLKPKGFFVLYLPNARSLAARFFGENWTYYNPEHLFSFSTGCLYRLLEKHGFAVRKLETAPKYLTIEYANNILARYPDKIGFLRAWLRVVPAALKRLPMPIPVGQMRILAWKVERHG